jgi:hypothetical protein
MHGFSATNLFSGFPVDNTPIRPKYLLEPPDMLEGRKEARRWILLRSMWEANQTPNPLLPLMVQVEGLACPHWDEVDPETPRKWWARIENFFYPNEPQPLRDECDKIISSRVLGTEWCDVPWQLIMLQEFGPPSTWPVFTVSPPLLQAEGFVEDAQSIIDALEKVDSGFLLGTPKNCYPLLL